MDKIDWLWPTEAAVPAPSVKVTPAEMTQEPDRLRAPVGAFDRKTYQRKYMRLYMRQRRAAAKAATKP